MNLDFVFHVSTLEFNESKFIEYYEFLKPKVPQHQLEKHLNNITIKIISDNKELSDKNKLINLDEYIILNNKYNMLPEFTIHNMKLSYHKIFYLARLFKYNIVEIRENFLNRAWQNDNENEKFNLIWLYYSNKEDINQLGQEKYLQLLKKYEPNINNLDYNFYNILLSFIANKNHHGLQLLVDHFSIDFENERKQFSPLFFIKDCTTLQILANHKDFDINYTHFQDNIFSEIKEDLPAFTKLAYELGFDFSQLDINNNGNANILKAFEIIKENDLLTQKISHTNADKLKVLKV